MEQSSGDLASLRRDVEVVADRLRHLPPGRLAPAVEPVREHVRRLAGLALAAEGVAARPLPGVAPSALGDQVAVLGHDLAVALERRPDATLLAAAHGCLRALRRVVP